jgi:AraC-like DNA-binding protein
VLSFITSSAIKIHYILSSLLVLLSACELFIVFYIRPATLKFVNKPGNNTHKLQQKEKKEQSSLLAQRIGKIVTEKKLFLDHQLDLHSLSEKTGINSHRITACIHDQFSISVPEYINNYRIEHAKRFLSEESTSLTKLDVLAHDCGFSSRSNFYSTFKRITGMTPSEYKKTLR